MEQSKLSKEERLRRVEQLFIEHPRLKQLLKKIEHCHKHSKDAAEPECLLIKGNTGVGKTKLRERYVQKVLAGNYPETKEKTVNGVAQQVTIKPVLASVIPAPATIGSLVNRMLNDLGDPMADKKARRLGDKTLQLEERLKSCEVELIILDEFQHFRDMNNNTLLLNTANWLKNLIDSTRIPIVLMGMPECTAVLTNDKQLERRFEAQESLEAFGWESAEERTEFKTLLSVIDKNLPLEPSNLSDASMAERLFHATGGVMAYLMKLIRRAAAIAIEQEQKSLSLSILAEAYEDKFTAARTQGNPFDNTPRAAVRVKLEPSYGTNRRVKAKRQETTLKDVL